MHTREIGGVDVAIYTDGDTVVVEIGGEMMSPEDVEALRPGPDWCRTVEIGPYTFGERSLTELQEFVRHPDGAARAGNDDAPPDPNLRGIREAPWTKKRSTPCASASTAPRATPTRP